MIRVLLSAAATTAVLAQDPKVFQQCYDDLKCIFETSVSGQTYSWDFRSLCKSAGAEYVIQDGSGDFWAFNVCGQVSFPCIPSDWSDPYAHGIAHQYLMGDPRTTLVSGNAACQAQVTDPTTGAQVCASQCVMAAHSYPDYELAVSGDVTSGVSVFHSASAPDATSPFNCPFDPTEGCSGSRRVTYNFLCDRSNKNPAAMTGLVLNETSTCNYLLTAYTYAACATKGDPFRNNQDNGPNNFGFTVLGATLCVVFQFMYSFGDQRGWWEPIKQRIPAIPGLSFLGGGKGGIYGGGGYRSVAAPTGAAAASPYGSTSM